jgi:hypothetical protein
VALSCWSSLAGAAELRWLGASDCRREAEVREQIESMAQRPLTSVPEVDFELTPERLESGAFQLQLTTLNRATGARETRVMQGATCAEVTDAAAVAIALAVGSAPDDAPRVPAKEPDRATTEPVPAGRPNALPPAAPDSKPSPPARWQAGLGATFDSAVTPHPVLGGALFISFRQGALRAEVEAGALAPSSKRDSGGRGGTFQLLYVAPRGCAEAGVGKSVAALCLAYELGNLSAEGEGVERPYSRSTFWHAVRPELGLAWPPARGFWLFGRAGAVLALARHTFVLDEPETVHRPPLLSFRAAVGLELEL